MSNRYYRSENCAETINKEFSMAETFWPNATKNATNLFSYQKDNLNLENELSDFPMRDYGEKCGEIFILNCSGDVVYRCQFCDDYYMNIGKLIQHCYEQHGFKDNRPKETLNKVLIKNRIDTTFETQNEFQSEPQQQEVGGDTSNQNVNNSNIGNNSNQIIHEQTQVNLETSNLPKLIQTPGGQKYILVSTPVLNNSFTTQQNSQQMQFHEPTQQTFGIVNPQFSNGFAQIPQDQSYIYNSPLHTVQTAFVNTPPHASSNNIVAGASSERISEENVQMSSFDNLIEFDSGSNSNQSPPNALHKDVGNTIEEIVANYPDEDNVLPPTTEQFVIATEEASSQCAQTYQDHETGNSDIISGNKIEALIEELVNSNSNSQQNYITENDNNQTPIVLSGSHPQTLFVQNPTFFTTNVQNSPDSNLVNQHIISHQGQPVLLNNEGVQQNYIFDGQHLQPTTFVNSSNNQNQTSNLYIKFNENDGNIYLLNGFNNNLNINGIIDANNQIQLSAQNDGGNETVVADEVNITEEVIGDSRKNTTENSTTASCEAEIRNFLNDSAPKLLQNSQESLLIKKSPLHIGDQMITHDNIDMNNIQMQHVSAEEIVAGSSSQMQETQSNILQSDNEINMQTDEQTSQILQTFNETSGMDISETDSAVILNSNPNLQKEHDSKTSKDLFSKKSNNETRFLDNFQKFLENKREEEMAQVAATTCGDEQDEDDDDDDDDERSVSKSTTEKNDAFKMNYSCKVCGRNFKEEFHLKIHNNKSAPIKCEQCSLSFCSLKLYNKHKKSHTNGETPVIKCDLCSLTFRSQHFLEMHMKNHNDVRPYKCNICKSTFRFQRYLDLHMNRHLGKKPYACNFCEKCFFTGTERSQHESIHMSKGCTYKCKYCDKEFSQRNSLVNHIKTHNNEKSSTLNSDGLGEGGSHMSTSTFVESPTLAIKNGALECDLCDSIFNSIELLQEHHKNAHKSREANISGSFNSDSLNSSLCNENYNQNSDTIQFANIDFNSCNNENSNNSSRHLDLDQNSTINTTTNNNNTNGNNDCNDVLNSSNNNDETQTYLNCEHCENKFLNNTLLTEHLNYCHSNSINNTNENNKKCRKCNLMLSNSLELSNHLNRCCCIEEEIDVVL